MTFNHGHALIIGVDSYKYAPRLDVSVASRDAEAVAGILSDPRYCGYPVDQTRVISKADATRDNILNASTNWLDNPGLKTLLFSSKSVTGIMVQMGILT